MNIYLFGESLAYANSISDFNRKVNDWCGEEYSLDTEPGFYKYDEKVDKFICLTSPDTSYQIMALTKDFKKEANDEFGSEVCYFENIQDVKAQIARDLRYEQETFLTELKFYINKKEEGFHQLNLLFNIQVPNVEIIK